MLEAMKDLSEYAKKYTEYVNILIERCDKDKLKEFSELRHMKMSTIQRAGIFYIGDMAELLVPKYLRDLESFGLISNTNKKPIFHDRWVIPIKNVKNEVINLVGYSPDSKERYVYGTGKYYDRQNTLYGLEKMPKAMEEGYAIRTEGITDALAVEDAGFELSLATCGTMRSTIKVRTLNRLRHGVIDIRDRDKPGDGTKEHWQTNRSFNFITPVEFKDASQTLSYNNGEYLEWFQQCMSLAVNWIKSGEHKGKMCACEESTMI